ncbi:hypothetical protein GCK72_002541 [Caenorhabditis remanei]|uniref:Tyrosine-protein kinase n=1 Tax=Caenorhabditis remanei TaxID=31234 RepID=A0A6A5HSN5_CAERE|nr:hypothetical protein GCK72_002541 [Caenorhabditis remanei]KAF1770719.1 hypothetical protein GCK72_002541 [Caenorhabditis remanei]
MREGCEKSQDKQEKTVTGDTKEVKGKLRHARYYHGVQKKTEAEKLMKDSCPGTFLVRSSLLKEGFNVTLFLSVKVLNGEDGSCFHHYIIEFREKQYYLMQHYCDNKGNGKTEESKPFPEIADLIAHYQHHRLACKIRLGRPFKYPRWQLKNFQVNTTGKLGAGNFCTVYKGFVTHRRDLKGVDVAVKVSNEQKRDATLSMETRNLLFAEAKIMINYKHPNVISFYGIAADLPPYMVCMEFCSGGSLEDALKKYGKDMEEFERQILLIDAARGMRYLHFQKCIHRDLASRNCLISSEGLVKIADFGLSKTLEKNQTAFKEALKEAPLAWLAPECIQRESEFSIKTDVWAFGVVIFEVYNNGGKLFDGEDDTVIIKRIRKANMPTIEEKTKLPSMQQVLSSIWTRKPDDRPDFQKVLEQLVSALLPIKQEDLKRMQINNLKGVCRTQMPNTSLDKDIMITNEDQEQDVSSEKNKNKSRTGETKRKTGNRKDRNSGKRTPREETPKSKKPVPVRNTIRKGPGVTTE